MARRIVLIKHEDSPGDDRAATWFAARGFQLDWRFPYRGESLAAPDESVAGTVLYGGPQSLTERDRYPFLEAEADWVRQCIAAGLPTLGFCLGGQVIAHALGAEVRPGPDGLYEFGYYEIKPTEAGHGLFPPRLVVTQSHFHQFDPPLGAVLLARSARFPHQAFRYGERTNAFQFHPEITRAGFRRWQDADWAHWGRPGAQTRAAQDNLAERHDAVQDRWFQGFLARQFDGVATI